MEDERISALLDSNNDLSLEITKNNETIKKLKTEKDSSKSFGFQLSTVNWLIQKINKQKSQYDTNFTGNEYSVVLTDSEIKFIQSIKISSEDDVKTHEDVEKLLKQTARAGYILSKLYKARDSYNKCTKLEAQKQSIQRLESEIKTLKETRVSDNDNVLLAENESPTPIADSSVLYDDLSTQTDFTPQITSEVYHRLFLMGQQFGTESEHLQALQQKVQVCRKSLSGSTYGYKKKISESYETFENLALTKKSLIKLKNAADLAFLKHSENLKDSLLNRTEILELVRNDKQASTALYFSDSSSSDQPNKRNSSSQTDISPLQLSLSFDEIQPNDTYENQIAKLHGQYLRLLSDHAIYSSHANRLRTYINNLSKEEEIVVLESDLSFKSRALLRKANSTIEDTNFEIDEAIKKSTESFKNLQVKCDGTDQSLRIDELKELLLSKNNLIDEQSKRITEIQAKLINQISDEESKKSLLIVDNVETERNLRCEQLKVKELGIKLKGKKSEISRLNSKISNQTKTNSQQRKKFQSELSKLKNKLAQEENCPICFDKITEKRKWTAFHKCGHRTCYNCYNGFAKNIHGNRLCPICRTVITVCVTLEGIY